MKSTEQSIQAARKAQSVLGMIKRQFKIIDKEDFGIIYKTYVRPHLEYCTGIVTKATEGQNVIGESTTKSN